MKKLTYTDDQQLINDAAQMLIEAHLRRTRSTMGSPREDIDNVRNRLLDARIDAVFTLAEWNEMGEAERLSFIDKCELLFEIAATLADRKWQAAMTLLGIEQQ